MIIKVGDKTIKVAVGFIKANKFSMENCKEEESLMSLIPQKSVSRDNGEFLVKMINTFQTVNEDETKLTKEEIETLLDTYFSKENSKSIIELYAEILKEFDYSGVFKKGMGFSLGKKLLETMNEMMENLEKESPTEKKKITE